MKNQTKTQKPATKTVAKKQPITTKATAVGKKLSVVHNATNVAQNKTIPLKQMEQKSVTVRLNAKNEIISVRGDQAIARKIIDGLKPTAKPVKK